MESTDSSIGSHQPHLPPGFRFHPTDEELVVHYLKKKASSVPLPVTIIAEVNLYKFDPWELPAKATFGEQEWYFFSPRDRKYPNGARPNRAATSGYWKATGTDKPVLTSGGTQKVGVKKALVFYRGKPPKGVKTSWIMHEYRLADNKPTSCRPTGCDPKRGSLRLDDWVLCRIYKKNSSPLRGMDQDREDSAEEMIIGGSALLNSVTIGQQSPKLPQPKPGAHHFSPMHETQQLQQQQQHDDEDDDNNNNSNLLDGIMGGDAIAYSATASVSMQSLFPVAPPATFPLKRTFLSSLYWNDGGCSASTAATATSADNRFHADCASGSGVGEGSSSFTALLGQAPPLHQDTMLGALSGGDGGGPYRHTYQLPGMNWFP